MTGQVITNQGRLIALNRLWKSSPDYTAPSLFSVGIGTTNPQVTDTNLETPVNINGGQTKAFVSGYPIFDESNMVSTVRCLLLTTEANGNSLTEFGIKNTDSTKKLFSHAVFTSLTKTTSVQVFFLQKDLIK